MAIQNGKKPLSSRASAKPAPLVMDDIFGNPLGIDADMVAVFAKKNVAFRFINATQLMQSSGHHPRAWRPISIKKLKEWGYDTIDAYSFTLGADPEGYIRRGDLVLAVRPMEIHEKHKAYLKQEAQRGKHVQKKHADELRKSVAESGVDVKVHEGFDDEETNE